MQLCPAISNIIIPYEKNGKTGFGKAEIKLEKILTLLMHNIYVNVDWKSPWGHNNFRTRKPIRH